MLLERFLRHSEGKEPFPTLGFRPSDNKAYSGPGPFQRELHCHAKDGQTQTGSPGSLRTSSSL